jgi:phenylacetate-CoA ligase
MISEVAGRADELRKIRGVPFTPVSVEELLREEFPEIEEYEIIVERKGAMDEITLSVEPREEMEGSALEKLSARLSERLKIKILLRFNINFAIPGDLPRHTLKSKRFKDLRRAKKGEG